MSGLLFGVLVFACVASIVLRREKVSRVLDASAAAPIQVALLVVSCLIATQVNTESTLSYIGISVALIAWAGLGGGFVVQAVFMLAKRDGLNAAKTALPASAWIGAVERGLIVLALCLQLTEFAAIVLGVKALGQYQMTDNHGAAGRVLGTLLSSSWALAVYAVFFVITM